MDKPSEDYDPRVNPAERWGEIDTTPENYSDFSYSPTGFNDNLQILGSLFTTRPEYIQKGLEREIGAEADKYQTGIADILVDKRIWEESSKPEGARAENGWYAVSIESRDDEEVAYDGFMMPVENLGWDVVLAVMDGEEKKITSQTDTVLNPTEVNETSREPYTGEKFNGHFMPYNCAT